MFTILIVEADIQQSTNMKETLNELDENLIVYEAQSKNEALYISNLVSIDIFYVDMDLKDSTGIDFAKELRKVKRYEFSWIVFLAINIAYMVQAFKETHCYDYILKPYQKKDILELTSTLISGKYTNNIIENQKKNLVFQLKSGLSIKMNLDEILFIEVILRTCIIHTKTGKYEVRGLSLKDTLELIDCGDIIQSYRSFLINVKYMKKVQNINSKLSRIYFENYNEAALLGYKFKSTVLEKFNERIEVI